MRLVVTPGKLTYYQLLLEQPLVRTRRLSATTAAQPPHEKLAGANGTASISVVRVPSAGVLLSFASFTVAKCNDCPAARKLLRVLEFRSFPLQTTEISA